MEVMAAATGAAESEMPEPFEPVVAPHRRAKKVPDDQTRNVQMAMLMELWRQTAVKKAAELAPAPARIPIEMVDEAWAGGLRGKELGLVVAAAAASLAIGLAYGPQAMQRIPGALVRGLGTGRGQAGGRGKGYAVNWAAELRGLLGRSGVRRMADGLVGGSFDAGEGYAGN